MKVHVLKLLALFLFSSNTAMADPPKWIPGALAVRCGESDWHLYDVWNFNSMTASLPEDFPQSREEVDLMFMKQISGITFEMLDAEKNQTPVSGSFSLSDEVALALPAGCEKKLITKNLVQASGQKIYFDQTVFNALPKSEQLLVSLRTAYNQIVKNPYEENSNRLFQNLILKSTGTSISEWIALQDLVFPHRFAEVDGFPRFIPAQNEKASAYFFGLRFKKISYFKLDCGDLTLIQNEQWILQNCRFQISGAIHSSQKKINSWMGLLNELEIIENDIVLDIDWTSWKGLIVRSNYRLFSFKMYIPGFTEKKWLAREVELDSRDIYSSKIVGHFSPEDSSILFSPEKSPSVKISCLNQQSFELRWSKGGVQLDFNYTFNSPANICVEFGGNQVSDLAKATLQYSEQAKLMKLYLNALQGLQSLMQYLPVGFVSGNCSGHSTAYIDLLENKTEIEDLRCSESSLNIHHPYYSGSYNGGWSYGNSVFRFINNVPFLVNPPLWKNVFEIAPFMADLTRLMVDGGAGGDSRNIRLNGNLYGNINTPLIISSWERLGNGSYKIDFNIWETISLSDATGKKVKFNNQGYHVSSRAFIDPHNPKNNRLEFALYTAEPFKGKCPSGKTLAFAKDERVDLVFTEEQGLKLSDYWCQ